MLKQTLICLSLTFSIAASAATVSHYGYTLNTDTNIVTGGGLQWLQWDETLGMTLSQVQSTYSTNGWRLATNSEMAALFNSFNFDYTFVVAENTPQLVNFNDPIDAPGPADEFISLFGDATVISGRFLGSNGSLIFGVFGDDADGDQGYNVARVGENLIFSEGGAELTQDYITDAFVGDGFTGYALVRAVPIPAAAWLFGSALAGLSMSRRILKRRH